MPRGDGFLRTSDAGVLWNEHRCVADGVVATPWAHSTQLKAIPVRRQSPIPVSASDATLATLWLSHGGRPAAAQSHTPTAHTPVLCRCLRLTLTHAAAADSDRPLEMLSLCSALSLSSQQPRELLRHGPHGRCRCGGASSDRALRHLTYSQNRYQPITNTFHPFAPAARLRLCGVELALRNVRSCKRGAVVRSEAAAEPIRAHGPAVPDNIGRGPNSRRQLSR